MHAGVPGLSGLRGSTWEDQLQGYNFTASAGHRYAVAPGSPGGYYPHVSAWEAFLSKMYKRMK